MSYHIELCGPGEAVIVWPGGRCQLLEPGWIYEYRGNQGFLPTHDEEGERWRGRIEGKLLVIIGRELETVVFDLGLIFVTEITEEAGAMVARSLNP